MSVHSKIGGIRDGCRDCCLTFGVVFSLALFAPAPAAAHGELLIRIAAVSRQIATATNDLARLHLQRGELYREDQNWGAAEADYRHAADLEPDLQQVDFCRAKLLVDSGRLEEARLLIEKLVANPGVEPEFFIERARLLVRVGQPGAAVKDFQRGLMNSRPQPEHFMELAQALQAEGEIEQALRSLDEGIRKCGPNGILQSYAVELDLQQKNYASAIVRLDTIIELIGRKEEWWAKRGDVLLLANRPDDARKSYKASLKAMDLLPKRLQQSPAMLKLQAQVRSALTNLTDNQQKAASLD